MLAILNLERQAGAQRRTRWQSAGYSQKGKGEMAPAFWIQAFGTLLQWAAASTHPEHGELEAGRRAVGVRARLAEGDRLRFSQYLGACFGASRRVRIAVMPLNFMAVLAARQRRKPMGSSQAAG
jgi:hypothetical protein